MDFGAPLSESVRDNHDETLNPKSGLQAGSERPTPGEHLHKAAAPWCQTIGEDVEAIAIDGWSGSENNNWGNRRTDTYLPEMPPNSSVSV